MNYQQLENLAKETGFTHVCPLDAATLQPLKDIRDACASNTCGKYDKCWTCPPACGDLDSCRKQLKQYRGGILVQTVGQLEDEFDWDGMKAIEAQHKKHFDLLHQQLYTEYPNLLGLGAGSCTHCNPCTYPDAPCRFPERQVSSMEAYGLLVLQVCKDNNMQYYYGPGTMSYTSCILLD